MLIELIKPLIIFGFVSITALVLVWLEVKVCSHIQSRLGYMYTGGFHGWAQGIADVVKLLLKEDIIPRGADRIIFLSAPLVVFIPVFLTFIVLPFSPNLIVRDMNIGLLYFLSIHSISVIGIIMAGWGSNSKYSLLGGMRSSAQLISYELPRALAVLGVVMLTGTLSTQTIVSTQNKIWWILLQPVGFFVYFVASLAESNRIPFDLPEAESELVAGFHTEYSSIRFAMFFMAEYGHLFASCALASVLFLGGWQGPAFLPPIVWFFLKTYFLIFVMIWLRWTLPRFRVDQLMELCWKVMIPLAMLNILITMIEIYLI